jgi:hypothetical protein
VISINPEQTMNEKKLLANQMVKKIIEAEKKFQEIN